MEKRLPFQGAPRSSTEKRARLSRSAGGRGGALAPSPALGCGVLPPEVQKWIEYFTPSGIPCGST